MCNLFAGSYVASSDLLIPVPLTPLHLHSSSYPTRSKADGSLRGLARDIFEPEENGETYKPLSQDDFSQGTYRIIEPGRYKLTEDIEFCPQKDNDYWPPTILWHKYPPAAYYLGFFAAMTVETDKVEIDLGGYTIQQCQEFYLVQHFFNVIELNNRVFVSNEGVSSLNYQKTDKPVGGPAAGDFITPNNVVIKNGSIGRSSHAGIHGNSITNLKIHDVEIHNFEVAGIQCNGCKDVSVYDSVVGPSAHNIPVLATFSNARFLEFFTQTLIPGGFKKEKGELRKKLLNPTSYHS